MDRAGILLCLVGPTGSGKSTISKMLLGRYGDELAFSVSVTTRPPRKEEKDGREYIFIDKGGFEEKIKDGYFFEYEQVHCNFYGTPKDIMERGVKGEHDLLFDIDIRGAMSIKKAYPKNGVIVFLVPPSFQVMKERLEKRGQMSDEQRQKRFKTAENEYALLLGAGYEQIDYFLVNSSLESAFEQSCNILETERLKLCRLRRKRVEDLCEVA